MSKEVSEVVKVLKEAKKLVRKGWTQGYFARDSEGRSISPDTRSAAKWCPLGALSVVRHTLVVAASKFPELEFLKQGASRISHRKVNDIAFWNDTRRRTKEQVMQAFDYAIEIARKEQSVGP